MQRWIPGAGCAWVSLSVYPVRAHGKVWRLRWRREVSCAPNLWLLPFPLVPLSLVLPASIFLILFTASIHSEPRMLTGSPMFLDQTEVCLALRYSKPLKSQNFRNPLSFWTLELLSLHALRPGGHHWAFHQKHVSKAIKGHLLSGRSWSFHGGTT